MITTERLHLVPATPESTRAALAGPAELGPCLRALVPVSWPPEYLDPASLVYTLERLAEGPDHAEWWLHFIVLRDEAGGRTLIGSGGFKGPPTTEGTVEIGYGIVSDHRRRGYASEATRGLLARAFAEPAVHRVIAETLPELQASIGEGSEPGVLRFEMTRAEHCEGGQG